MIKNHLKNLFKMVCKYCEERGKTWEGEDPICAFNDDGLFNKENWNCALLNELRELVEFLEIETYNKYSEDRIASIPNEDGFLILSWYKQRGKVDIIAYIDSNKVFKEVNLDICINTYELWKRELDRK